jgi:hypothetical protein
MTGGKVDLARRVQRVSERFVIGRHVTPERWHYIGTHADCCGLSICRSRSPRISWRNAGCCCAARARGRRSDGRRRMTVAPHRSRRSLRRCGVGGLRRCVAGERTRAAGGRHAGFARSAPIAVGRHFALDSCRRRQDAHLPALVHAYAEMPAHRPA